MIASTQLISSEISSTRNSERQYSPVLSCEAPIGANDRIATAVAPSSGHWVCFTTASAALTLSSPFCAAISTPSVMTMALSTSIPSAMMNAPRLIRSNRMPRFCMISTVLITVTTSTTPISTPLCIPMVSNRTATTMTTASIRLTRKPPTATFTLSAWCEITPNSMPMGVSARSSSRRRSMASPITTTLPPLTVEMPSPMQGLPS